MLIEINDNYPFIIKKLITEINEKGLKDLFIQTKILEETGTEPPASYHKNFHFIKDVAVEYDCIFIENNVCRYCLHFDTIIGFSRLKK